MELMAKRIAIPKSVRFEVFKRDSFKCQYCGRSAPEVVLHVDHIEAVAKGGDNDITNLITSCEPCNLGKGARRLDDSTAVQKAKAQLDELQERREQLEMLMAWRTGLRDISEDATQRAVIYWLEAVPGYILNNPGQKELGKLVRKFGLDEVLIAIDEAASQYIKYQDSGVGTQESVNRAWKTLGAVCNVNRMSKEKPHLRDLYLIRGMLRARLNYIDHAECLRIMDVAHSWGMTVDEIRNLAKASSSWGKFERDIIEEIRALQKQRGQ
jgi:hypothetical protein